MGCCNDDGNFDPVPAGSSILVWGNENVGAAADDRYLSSGSNFGIASLTDTLQYIAPSNVTLRDLFVRHNSAAGNGNDVIYTVFVNGVATALLVPLATGAVGDASNVVDTAAVLQGDRISIQASKAAGVGGGQIDTQVSLKAEAA